MMSSANRLQTTLDLTVSAQEGKRNALQAEALHNRLPWPAQTRPLMLAPMQGLTNQPFRSLLIDWVRPDVVFTELIQVKSDTAKGCLSKTNRRQITSAEGGVPLVVQLIGHRQQALVAAASAAQDAGAEHLNLNLGCPYGRMSTSPMGGGMLRVHKELDQILPALRKTVSGSFSLKLRSGYEDPEQVLSLLPLFEDSGVDFLIIHPRTVIQKYTGTADHRITAKVVRQTTLPVIANGDIKTTVYGWETLQSTGAAGLMLGRGAVNDPLLFMRLRGESQPIPDGQERINSLHFYLKTLLELYSKRFCGDTQVLAKMKEVIALIDEPRLKNELKALKKSRKISMFSRIISSMNP